MECIVDVVFCNEEPSGFYDELIVRCKDCEFAHEMDNGMYDCLGYLTEPWDYYNDCPKENPVEPNGYCAWGKSRINSNM